MAFARKQKKIKQSDLGKTIGTSGDIIGKYERATTIADALGFTLNYLVKDGQYEQIDNDTLNKLKAIQELDNDTKAHNFATIDVFIKASKIKNIAAL
ncbi:hypothetical protein SAMN05421664_2722 [Chryseobacterium soldanellicola]|uniref:HTH cro/C1-type domain-containing protein n=1 Tax=Chryseobacterium soldanellicola TaxID=311333 RepID=A0A1H1DZM2_9FLAO|nr:helix-turn-helix transcriptional regulator [Chryseobacterium soldanellicola]SDQ81944.1 hypothetical protein SAMN05421664_2722 [Chryseobacterium soldanellicola]